jgi:hypothetical protein
MTWHPAILHDDNNDPADGPDKAELLRMDKGMARLVRLVSIDAGLQAVAQAIAELFGHPVSIADTNFTFLALSKDYGARYPTVRDGVAPKYLPLALQERFRGSEVFHPARHRVEPVYFDSVLPDGSIDRNYTTLIYLKHVPVASISLFTEGEDIPQFQLGYLPTIASLISIELQKSNFYLLNKVNFFSHLLARLLDEDTATDDETIRRRLAIFGHQLLDNRQVILLDMRDENFDAAGVQSFADRFQSRVPNSVYFIDNGDIIYLASSRSPAPVTPGDADLWRKDVAAANVRIGLSSVFRHMSEFTRALAQARRSIDTGAALNVTDPVRWFDRYRLADLVRNVNKDVDLTTYLFPPLCWVIDHDQGHGTQLLYTLYQYLRAPNNPTAVSEVLFIHKNTLYYRLNQLREIMHVDLDSTEVRAQIHISFLILWSLHRLDWPASAVTPQ